jgi:hypothetical protein
MIIICHHPSIPLVFFSFILTQCLSILQKKILERPEKVSKIFSCLPLKIPSKQFYFAFFGRLPVIPHSFTLLFFANSRLPAQVFHENFMIFKYEIQYLYV